MRARLITVNSFVKIAIFHFIIFNSKHAARR